MLKATTTKRVLVVEDDVNTNHSLQKKLEKQGFATDACFDGKEALNLMREKQYDAILLDIVMPVVDGFEVLETRGETLNATTPVYVLTTVPQSRTERALELGAHKAYSKMTESPASVVAHIKAELEEAPQA